MEPMQPPDPKLPPPPTLPPRSTPIQTGGFPGWGAAPAAPPGPLAPGWTGPQSPYGMPFAPVPRTYGLATAALVCGLIGLFTFWILGIVPLLAVIFGLISARAIRSSGGTLRGLGMARAGLILGLLGVAGAAVFFWAGLTGRLDDEADTDAESDTSSVPFIEAELGDCVDAFPDEPVVYELSFVSCDVAHGAEVFHVGELNPDGTRDYPGDSVLVSEVQIACGAAFEPYVGRAYEESVFEVYYLYPRALGWNSDPGLFYCFLVEEGTTTVGSAFQSDR